MLKFFKNEFQLIRDNQKSYVSATLKGGGEKAKEETTNFTF